MHIVSFCSSRYRGSDKACELYPFCNVFCRAGANLRIKNLPNVVAIFQQLVLTFDRGR
jgi:hypothetical protein